MCRKKTFNGNSKGDINVDSMRNVYEEVPQLIQFTYTATQYHIALTRLNLQHHHISLFDRGYWIISNKLHGQKPTLILL